MGCSAVAAASPLPADTASTASHIELPPEPASAAKARQFVEEHCPPDHPRRAVALLVASELVTNVVLHARTPMELGVVSTPDSIVVAVTDANDDVPTAVGTAASEGRDPSDGTAEGGRGLYLVSRVATSWGVATRTRGKTIWCLLTTGADPPTGA